MSNIYDQLNNIRQKKHQEYLKRLEKEQQDENRLEQEKLDKIKDAYYGGKNES